MTYTNEKEKVYLLGLLWADGYVTGNKIGIELVEEDLSSLETLFKTFGTYTIRRRSRKDRQPQMSITIQDGELATWLISLGFKEKSLTSAVNLLEKIEPKLKHYWFRGYFDGDGCFYYGANSVKQAVLSGGYNQNFDFFISLLEELQIKFEYKKFSKENPKTNRINSHSRIRFNGFYNIQKFGNYIYQNMDGIGLKRKYSLYNKCIEKEPLDRLYTINGVTQERRYFLKEIGISKSTFKDRLKSGWSLQDALTTPNKRKTYP
jgi:hypothetical protein